MKGTVTGTLGSGGALTLKLSGKVVSKLATGRYTFAITDKDTKAGFTIIGPKSTAARTSPAVKFVGKRSKTLRLTPGRWTYYSSGLRQVHYLVVTGSGV